MMTEADATPACDLAGRNVRTIVRMSAGLLQGVLLAMLLWLIGRHALAGQDRWVAQATTLLSLPPLLFLLSYGRMRGRSIALLIGAMTLLSMALVDHAMVQAQAAKQHGIADPFAPLLFAILVFVVMPLASAADRDRRLWPGYPVLFDDAWDVTLILLLCSLFTLLSWTVLFLMAGLFRIVGSPFPLHLLGLPETWPMVSCVSFAAAVSWCVEGDRLIASARRLALALFGLLLPVLAVLIAPFLLSLAVVPLSRLWNTHHAGLLLSAAAMLLILLLNAVYQNGRRPDSPVMRWGGRLAAIELLPLVALCVFALRLRVQAEGWSIARVVAAAGFLILLVYGVGYLAAALSRGRWLRRIEAVNVSAAFALVLVLAALLSPVADPLRISVASQVARLRSGLVPAARFDFEYLAHGSGRYGRDALAALMRHPPGPDPAAVRTDAELAANGIGGLEPPTATDLASAITVHPAGTALPEGLVAAAASPSTTRASIGCVTTRGDTCDVVILPTGADGVRRAVFVGHGDDSGAVFEARGGDGWRYAGSIYAHGCEGAMAALLDGKASPGTVTFPALVLPQGRFRLIKGWDNGSDCKG